MKLTQGERSSAHGAATASRKVKRFGLVVALGLATLVMTGCGPREVLRFGWPTGVTPEAKTMGHLWTWAVIASLIVGFMVWMAIFITITFHRHRDGEDSFPRQTAYNMPVELVLITLPFLAIAVLFYFTVVVENKVDFTNTRNVIIAALILVLAIAAGGASLPAYATATCNGRFANPITDICWSCIFPLSLGSIKVSQGKVPDTANPSMPIQICPAPPPLFRRIGLAIGYWEPMALTDVTRSPGCMVNLGFSLPAFGKTAQGTAKKDEKQVNGAFYHVHWYKYPLTYWLNIITSLGCLEGGDLDIAYLSEIDPTWTDSSLTTILNPEAVIFANPIAQGACAADAIASAFNMPLDVLFWCAGSQGSMYPFNGWVSNESSPLQSSLLVSERMAFKLHRQGMIMETIGKNNAVCNEYPSPILPKERWRYQMVNMYPDSGQCHPFGRSVMRWETGKNPPNTKKNFGYLMWRKRNCVFL